MLGGEKNREGKNKRKTAVSRPGKKRIQRELKRSPGRREEECSAIGALVNIKSKMQRTDGLREEKEGGER